MVQVIINIEIDFGFVCCVQVFIVIYCEVCFEQQKFNEIFCEFNGLSDCELVDIGICCGDIEDIVCVYVVGK